MVSQRAFMRVRENDAGTDDGKERMPFVFECFRVFEIIGWVIRKWLGGCVRKEPEGGYDRISRVGRKTG